MAIHPNHVKNSFGRHLVLWVLFLPILTIILLPLMMPNQNIAESEVDMVRDFNIDAVGITAAANATFSSLFVKTGIMTSTEKFFNSGKGAVVPMVDTRYASKWIRGVWLLTYKAIWRLYVLSAVFLLPMLALCIPAAIDGFAIRARKKYRFESYNPILFYSSMHTAVLIVGLFAFLPLAPIALSSTIMAALLVGLCFAVWTTTSNFQTGS